jgi:hypothetical protein
MQRQNDIEHTSQKLSLTIILEYKQTYFGRFKPSQTILEICKETLRTSWPSKTHVGDWKISDRNGNVLSMFSKLEDNQIWDRETLFMSQKPRDPDAENLLVRIENLAEEKFFPLGKLNEKQEENEKEKRVKTQN